MDNGISGTVEIDYIKIGKLSASNVTVTLNNHHILSEKLMLQKDDLFTLPLKYDINFSIREQPGWLKIPIDINSLKTETLLNITLDGYASWKISSVVIYLVTRTADIHPPAWQLIPNYRWMPITAIISGFVISLMLFNARAKIQKRVEVRTKND